MQERGPQRPRQLADDEVARRDQRVDVDRLDEPGEVGESGGVSASAISAGSLSPVADELVDDGDDGAVERQRHAPRAWRFASPRIALQKLRCAAAQRLTGSLSCAASSASSSRV